MTGVALDELKHLPQNKPWFLWVSYPGPHEPFDVPASWRGNHGLIPPPEERPSDPEPLGQLAAPGSELARKLDVGPMESLMMPSSHCVQTMPITCIYSIRRLVS